MQSISYPIDWSDDYPPNCTPRKLRKMLKEKAAHWRGWEEYPWYLTRTLHRHLERPPADWDHLHACFWMQGHAAHALLKETFDDRGALFELLIEHKVQFTSIFRHIVIDQIHWCLVFNKQDRLPDCALWGADTPNSEDTLKQKRGTFREGIEHAVSEYVRLLDFATVAQDPSEWMTGHPLRVWFRGAHLPDPAEIGVRLSEEGGRVFLRPEAKAAARFLSRRVPIPRIEVCPDGLPNEENEMDPSAVQTAVDEDTSRTIAFRAFELATRFDERDKKKAPAHVTVLRLYCCDGLSVQRIADKCGCSKGTVMSRKKDLEAQLGISLEAFRRHSAMLKEAARTAEYAKAKKIYRKGLLE